MDYLSHIPSTKHEYDFLLMVVNWFSKMEMMALCNKSITIEAIVKLFFKHVWVHFELPWTIISDRDSRFLKTIWSSLWCPIGTKLTKLTTFHP